ncbi:hypothetical protein JCM3765_003945 [Sporobolomyces pararoseus]
MPLRPPGALPELFLTFLAPSFRPSLPRTSTSRQPLSTLTRPRKDSKVECECYRKLEYTTGVGMKKQKRGMSRLATRRSTEGQSAEVYFPVASTSALQLDSPFPSSFPPTSLRKDSTPIQSSEPLPAMKDDSESALSELPSVLKSLKSLSLEFPDKSPSEIISLARASAFKNEDGELPPTPPPPILLHPQPYTSDSHFFTPFLLQAMILGASALGLLARRKVRTGDSMSTEADSMKRKTARQEAEDRIDEVQALNLLISAHSIPEAYDAEEKVSTDWRKEMLKPVINFVTRAVQSNQPLDRLGVASILNFISPTLTPVDKLHQARPLLAAQAFEAYQSLPPLVNPSTLDSKIDNFTISSFLALIYPRSQQIPCSPTDRSLLNRTILNTLSDRILSNPSDFPPRLLFELGRAAARAKRLDTFQEVVRLRDLLSPRNRLELAVNGLDLVASQQQSRNDREKVLRFAELFTSTIEEMREFGKEEVTQLDRGIYLLRTAFSIDRPLEPFISRSIVSTLSTNSSLLDNKMHRSIVIDVLQHLVKSRNPSLARQILSSIPPHKLRISYLVPLLSSSHSSTSQSTWDLLLSHSTLRLTEAAVSARFSSLSHRSNSPSILQTARQDFKVIREQGVVPSVKIWNKFLHVVVRFGGDRAVENVRSAMGRAGIEENDWTRTILLQREMIRQDVQLRIKREGNRIEGKQKPMSERPEKELVRVKRRGGGQAQMRKLRVAVREYQTKGGGKGGKIDITPNLLLKNFTRWTGECDTNRLLQLTKVVLGLDLTSSSSESSHLTLVPSSSSEEEHEKLRVPAFKTLISAFERRGEKEVAKRLRADLKLEQLELIEKEWR